MSEIEEDVYYRVKLVFKHDTRFHKAGEIIWLGSWNGNHSFWQISSVPLYAHRFPTIKAAREAAVQPEREDYGGDKCCERIIERVIEKVERVVRVKAPKKKVKVRRVKKKSCADCRSMQKVRT